MRLIIGILYLILIKCVHSTKLNSPRVLLPIFDKLSINFTLEVVEKGCFKWKSARQDLIRITPLNDDSDSECSSRAIVTSISREKIRSTTFVLAEDIKTGETLRCDVILDIIDKLEVWTTTRELFLEEAPETFEIKAMDPQGNSFSTLEGVEFNWMISSENTADIGGRDSSWQQVLRFLTFTESRYHEVPPALENFEALNLKGYMVLLEGINTGTAKVSVRLPHPEYSEVPGLEVEIVALANIFLDPTDVYLMVGDTVQFRISQLKQGKIEEISLNSQYYLELEDNSLGKISGNSVTGTRLGRTFLILRDRNVPTMHNAHEEISPAPRASLTITTPHKLAINLLPHFNWITVEGEKHEIAIDLYTHDDQKIWLGPRYKIESDLDETSFFPLKKVNNGSRIFGEAVKAGRTLVTGRFQKLTAKAELIVLEELTLTPSKVVLPYDPNSLEKQKVQFTAEGGDGSYSWSSINPNLLKISQNGIAETRISAKNIEETLEVYEDTLQNAVTKHAGVRVALSRNMKIFRTAHVYFLPPVKLEILKYNFETSLKDYVALHIAVYAKANGSYVPFTKCNNLDFNFELTNSIFQLDLNKEQTTNDSLEENACRLVYLRAINLGTTHLTVTYNFHDKILKDDVPLIVFDKLQILNPINNEIVLPIGASRNVIYTNGPPKVFNIEADLQKISQYDRHIAEVIESEVENNSKQIHVYEILCQKVGETVLKLEFFNTLQRRNFKPYISSFSTKIYCVKPRFINLFPTEELRQSCPYELKKSLMHVKNKEQNIEIEIEVLDSQQRKLMNISSLVLEWEFAHGDEKYHSNVLSFHDIEEEIVEGVRIPSKDFLKTIIADTASSFKVKSTVVKYDSTVLNYYEITPESPQFGIQKSTDGVWMKPVISNEITLMTVNKFFLPNDEISIFLAKNSAQKIPIAQGSGYYDFKLSEDGIVSIDFDSKTRQLLIIPHQIGFAQVELIDRCLMTEPAILSISVVSIGSIQIRVADRVEKTKTIEAIVLLFDSNENLLHIDRNNLQIYELNYDIVNPTLLSMKLGDQLGLSDGEIRYIVSGHELGETKIIFTSGYSKENVASDAVTIQVFPPLRLYPRNSTLIVGSSVQIHGQGGPYPDSNIEYSFEKENIISIESALVQAHKIGNTKITGRCVGIDPANGKKIIFSEDTIEIYVVPLNKIKIRTPLVRIKSGAVMPAAVWGVPELSPMVLGTLDSLRVTWSTNQPDVLDIYGIFAEAGIEYTDQDLISIRVRAINPGKAKLLASVLLDNGVKLSASVEITVFKLLELESPKHINLDTILVKPQTSLQLKTNLDDAVFKLENAANRIIRVTADGLVMTNETLGRDLIIASTLDQTLPIAIEVKNIQYILASIYQRTAKLRQTEEKIPRGMNIVLKVSLHDNLGNEFSHNLEDQNAGIKYDLSHRDTIDLQIGKNLTVAINLPRETSNMISIALKDSHAVKYFEDFIKISVAESKNVFPTKTIFSVGDIICFESPLTSTTSWSCSDERLVTINRNTGVGKVLNNRFKLGEKVTITNGDMTENFLNYDIEVREADEIKFFESRAIFSGNTYTGHLVIRNHLQMEKSSNFIARNISKCSNYLDKITAISFFTCKLSSKHEAVYGILQNFKITPIFDVDHGTYACEIEIVTSLADIINIIKSNEINIELEAQLPNGVVDIATLKIVPAIKVMPDAISVDEIAQQGITITGLDRILQKIEVKTSDTSVLEVKQQTKIHGSLQYKVKLLNELPSDEQLFVQVYSPLTQQTIEIPIVLPNAVQKCSTQPFSNSSAFVISIVSNFGLIISALFVLAISIWGFIFCFPQRSIKDVNTQAFVSPFKTGSPDLSNLSGSSYGPASPPRGPCYPNSPYFPNRSDGSGGSVSPNLSSGNELPVYGDPTLISPQKRINRRFL